jgi:GAF domain-containing protein
MTMSDEQRFLENGERFIAGSSDLNKAVEDLVRIAAESAGSNMGALYVLDENGGLLKPAVLVNLPDDYVKGCGPIPVGQQCCGRAVLHRLPWYVEDIWNDPFFPPETRDAAKRAGVRAGLSVPVLTSTGKCVAALSAHFPHPHTPAQDDIRRHSLFAQLIGYALSRQGEARIAPESVPSISQDSQATQTGT